jgi:hypothetical protein
MHWETYYKKALIEALHPFGDVLQVGFGSGIVAQEIQSYHPKSHTIIESNPLAVAAAKKVGLPYVTVIHDTWQNAILSLGEFDTVFFNEFSRDKVAEVARCREQASMVVAEGQATIAMIKQTLPQLTTQCYSDADLEEFFQALGTYDPQQMTVFLAELHHTQQISQEQYVMFLLKYKLKRAEPKVSKVSSPAFVFFQDCLKHLRFGGRFSCFSPNPLSKYEDPDFFESIITNPNFDYHEHTISVSVPSSCDYYPFKEALVLVIQKHA